MTSAICENSSNRNFRGRGPLTTALIALVTAFILLAHVQHSSSAHTTEHKTPLIETSDTNSRGTSLIAATRANLLWMPDAAGSAVSLGQPLMPGSVTDHAKYQLPILGATLSTISRHFTPNMTTYGPGHRGIDIASGWGMHVVAPSDGVVDFRGFVAGRQLVVLHHVDGLRSTLEAIEPVVEVSDRVVGGQIIGSVIPGHSCITAPSCLHWGVRNQRGEYINPLILLYRMRARLLPDIQFSDLKS